MLLWNIIYICALQLSPFWSILTKDYVSLHLLHLNYLEHLVTFELWTFVSRDFVIIAK